jgi:hypothetical protein
MRVLVTHVDAYTAKTDPTQIHNDMADKLAALMASYTDTPTWSVVKSSDIKLRCRNTPQIWKVKDSSDTKLTLQWLPPDKKITDKY